MFKKIFTLCALTLITAASSQASSILPGTTIAASQLNITGSVVTFFVGPLSTGTGTANYNAIVYSDSTNPFCSGCLDFVYNLDTQNAGAVTSFSVSNFANTLLNVGYTGGGFAPTTISRSADGSVVTFNFGSTGLPNATVSTYLVIQTPDTTFTTGTVSLTSVSGVTSSNPQSFSPVPEPSTLLLMGSGLAGLAGAVKRRFIA